MCPVLVSVCPCGRSRKRADAAQKLNRYYFICSHVVLYFRSRFYRLRGGGDDPVVLQIITSSLPDGTVNQPYSSSVSGSGGFPPYTWSVTPALPANLSFDTTTGTITGTPVTVGTSSHTFTLHDSLSPPQTVQRSLTLTINPIVAVLSITTTSLPDGTVGQAYTQPVQATGGTGALTWSIVAGTLPQGLSLNPTTGVISGTPTAAGTSSFTVRVADTAGQAATQALSILINLPSPPNITTTTLPGGTVGQAYESRVAGNRRDWNTCLESLWWIAPSESRPQFGWNHFRHSNQYGNLELHREGH